MNFASLIMVPLAVATMFLGPQVKAASNSFDGTWTVVLNTPEYKDPTGVVARAYTFEFPATVTGGVLHGEHGTRGQPAWLELSGAIQPNGSATLHANGISGRPDYNLGHVESGRPYKYNVDAHFKGKQGSGHRIGGRIGNYRFTKG